MINPNIVKVLSDNNINLSLGLSYIFCLHHLLDVEDFSDELKTQVLNTGLLERDYFNPTPTVKMSIPLYIQEVQRQLVSKGKDFDSFVQVWIQLFPTQSITGLPYAVSGNTSACITRMSKFIKDFSKVFPDLKSKTNLEVRGLILNATKNYLAEQKHKQWAYTKKNVKFIQDQDGSYLETYIRRILAGHHSVTNNTFTNQL